MQFVFSQLPSAEEMSYLLLDKKMTTVVYFLDETFDDLIYDMATTVIEAVEQLAGIIKLQNYSTFTLFEARKASSTHHTSESISLQACNLSRGSTFKDKQRDSSNWVVLIHDH